MLDDEHICPICEDDPDVGPWMGPFIGHDTGRPVGILTHEMKAGQDFFRARGMNDHRVFKDWLAEAAFGIEFDVVMSALRDYQTKPMADEEGT